MARGFLSVFALLYKEGEEETHTFCCGVGATSTDEMESAKVESLREPKNMYINCVTGLELVCEGHLLLFAIKECCCGGVKEDSESK